MNHRATAETRLRMQPAARLRRFSRAKLQGVNHGG